MSQDATDNPKAAHQGQADVRPRKARARSKKKSYMKWVIGLGVLGMAALIVTQLNFGDGMVYFYTPKEVLAKKDEVIGQDKAIMVGAMVKAGTVTWNPEKLELDFVLTDFKGNDITVAHKGIKPDLFKENQGVVVEGKFSGDGKVLMGKKLIVKHSEEYKVPHKGESVDKQLLQESIFKNQALN